MTKYARVPGYRHYRVGDDGTVWSRFRRLKWRKMPLTIGDKGYRYVKLHNEKGQKSFTVHRLVLTCFVGPRPAGMEACHFPDRDTGNNNLSNLSWGSKKVNASHVDIHGTRAQGSKHGLSVLTEKDVLAIRRMATEGKKLKDIASEFGVTPGTISHIVSRITWRHV